MKLSTSILSAVLGLTTLVAALPQSSGNLFERQTTSPDNTCGLKEAGANRGYRCPASDKCCSQYGWCGNTDAYCGTGCQPGYGACNGVTPPPTTTTTIRTTSTTSTRPTTSTTSIRTTSTTSIRTTSTTSIRTTSTTSIRTTTTPTPSPTGRPRPGSVPYGVQISQCSVPGVVALTFDDGPFAYTQELLNLLARHNVKATFFVNGQNWGAPITTDATQQQTLRNMYAAGHHIASHTFAHPDLSGLSAADMRTQMLTLETALKNIIGVYPTYMRPPYFSCSGTCFQVMNELSYHVIYANIDPLDWQYNTDATNWQAQNIFNNAVSSIPASQGRWIVLNHDVHATTVRQLAEYEIVRAKALGYRLVTVGECMGDPQANWYRV